MEGGAETPKCRVSIIVTGEMPGAQGPFMSTWPEMETTPDDASNADYGQYAPPKELRILLDETQAPPEIRDIVLNSLDRPEGLVSGSEEPKSAKIPSAVARVVSIPGTSESSQVAAVGSHSDQSHSRSASITSLSLSTSRTTNDSDDGVRHTTKKATLSALLSSATNLIGSVKHAIKDSSTTEKNLGSKTVQKVTNSSESECASCLEDLPTRKMYNLRCKHSYCAGCFTTLVTTAMKTEPMFPPKCCLSEISMKDILSTLDKTQKELYKSKAAEYTLKPENRWYCPNTECGKWIPPSKLHRLRILGARCPSCDTRICGYCRGMAHEAGIDCPEDFGLEATLEEAERQGWRRCCKCRALVELTVGCRHITCKCGAQFCYTCGAKWRTCTCSEVDQQRRQTEIAERRNARSTRSREEEEEIAQAISAIEEMERREAEEQAREAAARERKEALQRAVEANERRRREHLERLEAEKRRLEEKQAARRREGVIRSSITERINYLRGALLEIHQFQQSSLISRHNSEITALNETSQNQQAIQKAELDSLQTNLTSNSQLRQTLFQSEHEAAVLELTSKHESEEDDTFVSMQSHLRGKPNRDARIKAVMDKLQQCQKEETDKLVGEHTAKITRLDQNVCMERNALESGYALHSADETSKFAEAMAIRNKTVLTERKWFEVVAERRREMMEGLQRQLWSSIDRTEYMPRDGESPMSRSPSSGQIDMNQEAPPVVSASGSSSSSSSKRESIFKGLRWGPVGA